MACLPCMLALLGLDAANPLGQQQWNGLDLEEKRLRRIVDTMASGQVADSLYAALDSVRTNLNQAAGGSTQVSSIPIPFFGINVPIPTGKTRVPDWESGNGALWDMEYKRNWDALHSVENELAKRTGVPTLTQQPPAQPAVTEAANTEGTGTTYVYKGPSANTIGPTGWDYMPAPVTTRKATSTVGILAVIAIVGAAAYFLWPKKSKKGRR